MSKKNKGKGPGKRGAAPVSLKKQIEEKWLKKYPILLFVLAFSAMMFVFYYFISSDFFSERLHPGITELNARISGFILQLTGQDVSVEGSSVFSQDFSINVAYGCDALEPCAILTALILAFPSPFRKKLPGLVVGIFFLLILNLFRIITLYLTGVYFPSAFEIMHVDIWQVVFIFFAIAAWVLWIQWAIKTSKPQSG